MSAGVSVVVLAGGASTRFGSSKLEAVLDGRPLLDHVLELARRLSDDVVVAVAPGAHPLALQAGVRAVEDPDAFGGPLVGIASAHDVVDGQIAIVLGGDMPRLGIEIVEPMLLTLVTYPDVDAVVLEQDGATRPLPMVVRTEPARAAARELLAGETGASPADTTTDRFRRSLRALLSRLRTRPIPEEHWTALDPARTALADVDRPEDLEVLR